MRKSILFPLLFSPSLLLFACSDQQIENSSSSSLEETLTYQQIINGEGEVYSYFEGTLLTETNFSEVVSTGDLVTIVITPASGYQITEVTHNETLLYQNNDNYYSFNVVDGSNILEVTFGEVITNNDDFTYQIVDSGVYVTSYNPTSITLPDPLVIPDEVMIDNNLYPVTGIGPNAFLNVGLQGIRIGKNLNYVDPLAFRNLRTLETFYVDEENSFFQVEGGILYQSSTLIRVPLGYLKTQVNIKNGTTNIAPYAFDSLQNVRSVNFPSTLESIGEYAFQYSSGLESLTLPDSLLTIGEYAFQYCNNLRAIDLGSSLSSLGAAAFYSSGLESINFPRTLTSVPAHCFHDCQNLETASFSEGLLTIDEQAFTATGLLNLKFPSTLETIKRSAFGTCRALRTVNFNEGLREIGDYAFSLANNIEEIFLPSTLETIGINPFSGITRLGNQDNFQISSSNEHFEIIDNVLYQINEDQTYTLISYPLGNTASSFEVPDNVTYLASEAFIYQRSLVDIYLPRSITDIDSAFSTMYTDLPNGETLTLSVHYEGTKDEFSLIDLHGDSGEWHAGTNLTDSSVFCSDGSLIVI